MQQTSNDANHSHEAKKKCPIWGWNSSVCYGMDIGWLNWNFTRKSFFFFRVSYHIMDYPPFEACFVRTLTERLIDIPPSQTLFFLQKCWNELTSKSFATLLTLSNVLSQNCTGGKLQFLSYSVITLTGMRGSGLLLTAFDLICHRIIKKSICQWKVNKRKSTQKETTEQSKNFYFQYYSHSAKLK